MATYILRRMHYQKLQKFYVVLNSQQSSLLGRDVVTPVCSSLRLYSKNSSSDNPPASSTTEDKKNVAKKTILLPKTSAHALSQQSDQITKKTSAVLQLDPEEAEGEKVPVLITGASLENIKQAMFEIERVLQKHIEKTKENLPVLDRPEELLFIPKECADQLTARSSSLLREIQNETASQIKVRHDMENEHGILVTVSAAEEEHLKEAMEKIQSLIANNLSESEEMTVSQQEGRIIMGRKGLHRRDLENATGTKISVRFNNSRQEALVTIQAKNLQELETAKEKIQKVMERSKYPKRKINLTSNEKFRLIGKDGNNIRRIRENLKQMNAGILEGKEWLVEAEDEENLDKAMEVINKELEKLRIITKTIKVSDEEAGSVIGKGGENIKQIQQKLQEMGSEVRISIPKHVTPKCFVIESTNKEDVDSAVAMIKERLEKIRSIQKKTLEISQQEARYLIGPRGEQIASIREQFAERGININIPKKMTGEKTNIQIIGYNEEDINEVVNFVEEKIKTMKLRKHRDTFSVSWEDRGRLIGQGGDKIKKIRDELKQKGVEVILPSQASEDKLFEVRVFGESKEKVQEAITMLEETIHELKPRTQPPQRKTLTLSWEERGKLLGKGGENFARIQKTLNEKGIGMKLPPKANKDGSSNLELVGENKELVQEAVAMIEEELRLGESRRILLITYAERGKLIGPGGEHVKRMRESLEEKGISIRILEQEDHKTCRVVITAQNAEDLEETTAMIYQELGLNRSVKRVDISRDAALSLIMGKKRELQNQFGDKLELQLHIDNHKLFEVDEKGTALVSIECEDSEITQKVSNEIEKLKNETWTPYKVNIQYKDSTQRTGDMEQILRDVLDMTNCFYYKPEKGGKEVILFVRNEEDYELALARIKEHAKLKITESSEVPWRIDISRDAVVGLLMGKRRDFENKFGDCVKLRLPLDHQASLEYTDPQIAEELLAEIQELNKTKWLPHTINVEDEVAKHIIGVRSQNISDIIEKTNCYLSFKEAEDGRDLTIYARNEEDFKAAMARINEFIEHKTDTRSTKKIKISRDAYLGLITGKRRELETKFENQLKLKLSVGDFDIFHNQEAILSATASIECEDPETIKEIEAEIEELNKIKWLHQTMKVGNELAQKVIGHKGETVKDIMEKTNCFLNFKPKLDGEELVIYGRNEEDINSALAMVNKFKKQLPSMKRLQISRNAVLDLLTGKREELENKFGNQVKLVIRSGLFYGGKDSIPVTIDCKDSEILEEVKAEIEELGGTNWLEHKMIMQQEVVKRVVGFRGQNIKEIMQQTNCYMYFTPTQDGEELSISGRTEEDVESAIAKVNEYSKYSFTPERIGEVRVPKQMPQFKDEDEELLYRIEEALDKREIQITQKPNIPEDFSFSKVEPLKIWSKEDLKKPEPQDPTDNLWYQLEREEHERLVNNRVPYNGFEEMIKLTREGKMWHYPIDNEQGIEEEKDVSFADHVFNS
ncbi:vigilin-like [Saccostrea cucullata]|uniref:vigilin-like n=1 Tax=Saccostrea cuccullata TaxID=36930 RepID=UPI002ED6A12B